MRVPTRGRSRRVAWGCAGLSDKGRGDYNMVAKATTPRGCSVELLEDRHRATLKRDLHEGLARFVRLHLEPRRFGIEQVDQLGAGGIQVRVDEDEVFAALVRE